MKMIAIRSIVVTFAQGLCTAMAVVVPPSSAAPTASNWAYIDNGTIRLGIDKSAGGCIGFLGESKTGRNLLNTYDLGRYIAQSYYGAPDGSLWNRKPWRWNPVQGGDWHRNPAQLLTCEQSTTSLHTVTLPKHWASGADIPEMRMEQWITLEGATARVRYEATYTGTNHPPHHQELPALYFDNRLSNFVYYAGTSPWTDGALVRRTPGVKNEYVERPEAWTACVDATDWGIGVFTPGTTRMTYFYVPGPSGPDGSGCSYFAPIRTLAVTNGFRLGYAMYMTVGTLEQIRTTFRSLRN